MHLNLFIVQKAAAAKADGTGWTVQTVPGMVLRGSMKAAKLTTSTTSANSTTTTTSTTNPARRRIAFADDAGVTVHPIEHHSDHRALDPDYDTNNFTARNEETANQRQQRNELNDTRVRGLTTGEFYFKVPESEAEEAAQRMVWELVEAAMVPRPPANRIAHHPSHHTAQLGNPELLQNLKDYAEEIAAAYNSSLRRAYTSIVSSSEYLVSCAYTPIQLQSFVAASKGSFRARDTRKKIEHAHESARQIVATLRAGMFQDTFVFLL